MKQIKADLRIVGGNDFALILLLTQKDTTPTPLDLDALDDWEVVLHDADHPCMTLRPKCQKGEDEGTVIVEMKADSLHYGTYGIEFLAHLNGSAIRSYEAVLFGIVERNGQANVTFDIIEGEKSCDVDMSIQLVDAAITRGKNAYEYWKEIPGNEDKTLQDYLDTLEPVQSDWEEDDAADQAFIKNKPTIPAAQVQSDWNQALRTAVDFIKNKPMVYSVSSREFDLMGATLGLYHIIDSARGGIIISSGFLDSCDQVWIDVEHGYVKTRKMTNGTWGSWSDPIYQPMLISGTNIKTINNQSLLGNGNIDIQGGGGDSSLVHWTFTQEGPFESPTWDTDGHKYSDIASTLNDGNTLLVTMKDLDAINGLFVYWMGGLLLPLQDTTSILAYQLTEGTNDSINVTSITLSHSVIETISSSNAPTERSVTLYGDDTINGTIKNVAKVEVDSDGVEIITSNGRAATYNGNEIYAKPSAGIPKTDLASAVQTSLGKADTALQAETDPTVQAWAKTGIRLGNTVLTPETLGFLSSLFDLDVSQGNLTIRLKTGDATPVIVTGIVSSNDDSGWEHAGNGALPTVGLVYNKVTAKYTKPSGGIPKTDLASAVQTSLGKADTAYQKPSAGIPASDLASGVIPDVSGKADKVVVVDASTLPSTLDPNKVYQMGTLTGSVTIPAFSAVASGDTEAKIWCFTFNTSTTAPTITWPVAITNWVGGSAPTINASKNYEVTVMDGIGAIMEA